jgi:hypothetical protein
MESGAQKKTPRPPIIRGQPLPHRARVVFFFPNSDNSTFSQGPYLGYPTLKKLKSHVNFAAIQNYITHKEGSREFVVEGLPGSPSAGIVVRNDSELRALFDRFITPSSTLLMCYCAYPIICCVQVATGALFLCRVCGRW